MNWLDILFLIIIMVCLVVGIVKGLWRQLIGIIAVLAGLVLAALYYKGAGDIIDSVVHNELFAYFLGFLLIFLVTVIAGVIIGYLLTRMMKGPMAAINRILGGALGALEGILICGILVFALQSFQVARPAMASSKLSPLCFKATRTVINLIPQDVKNKFESSYKEIRREDGGRNGQKI